MENVLPEDENNDFDLDEDFDQRPGTPIEIIEADGTAAANLLPSKSKLRYEQAYNNFLQWKTMNGATSNSERVLLAYFNEMTQKSSPSTLWARYSMVKALMKINDSVDISTYAKLIALLKNKSKGYVTKKAKTFTESQVQTFIDNALDVAWLDVKVT